MPQCTWLPDGAEFRCPTCGTTRPTPRLRNCQPHLPATPAPSPPLPRTPDQIRSHLLTVLAQARPEYPQFFAFLTPASTATIETRVTACSTCPKFLPHLAGTRCEHVTHAALSRCRKWLEIYLHLVRDNATCPRWPD